VPTPGYSPAARHVTASFTITNYRPRWIQKTLKSSGSLITVAGSVVLTLLATASFEVRNINTLSNFYRPDKVFSSPDSADRVVLFASPVSNDVAALSKLYCSEPGGSVTGNNYFYEVMP
jgi:hypothetical protein